MSLAVELAALRQEHAKDVERLHAEYRVRIATLEQERDVALALASGLSARLESAGVSLAGDATVNISRPRAREELQFAATAFGATPPPLPVSAQPPRQAPPSGRRPPPMPGARLNHTLPLEEATSKPEPASKPQAAFIPDPALTREPAPQAAFIPEPASRPEPAFEPQAAFTPEPAFELAQAAWQPSPAAPSSAPPPRGKSARRSEGTGPLLSDVHVTTDLTRDFTGEELAPESGADRRTDPRIRHEFELEFNYDSYFYAGLSLDISTGGLFVATYHLLPVGTELALSFQLPDETRVSVRGEVRWVRSNTEGEGRPGMGVAFTEISPDALKKVVEFCAERPPRYIDL